MLYIYVVECADVHSGNGRHNKFLNQCAWTALAKTQIRDGIHVFHTWSQQDTASFVTYVMEQAMAGSLLQTKRANIPGLNVHKRKRDNLTSTHNLPRGMLTVIPGMSNAKAESVLAVFPSAQALIDAPESEISSVMCGKQCLGGKAASVIKQVWQSNATPSPSAINVEAQQESAC